MSSRRRGVERSVASSPSSTLALGLAGPVLGAVVGWAGFTSAFAVGTGATLAAIVLLLAIRPR